MRPEEACQAVHALLYGLPEFKQPAEVPITDGLYFFYEDGESSQHAPDGRIVRVGNHPRPDGTLVRRLRQHYYGRKIGSVFRKFLGGALMRTENPSHPSHPSHPCLASEPGKGHWERQHEKPCHRYRSVEPEQHPATQRAGKSVSAAAKAHAVCACFSTNCSPNLARSPSTFRQTSTRTWRATSRHRPRTAGVARRLARAVRSRLAGES